MRKLRSVGVLVSLGLLLAMLPAEAKAAPGPDGGLSDVSVGQIEALTASKLVRTPAQRKVDSPVLAAAQQAKGRAMSGAPALRSALPFDDAGRTPLEVRGTVDDRLLKRVVELGGRVRDAQPARGVASIDLTPPAAEELANDPGVTRIVSVAAGYVTSRSGPVAAADTQQLVQGIQRELISPAKPTSMMSQLAAGSVTSEGDTTHGTAEARARFRVSGIGITVGVLSDGVDSGAASIASGDLPADLLVLPGQAGAGDEGTAMLEIVHDLAPKADLIFATAANSADSFAANIRALREQGADIIVDDVLYYAESPFQDGPIAQAVIDVTRDGALYVSSAGNEGNLTDGTSGNYEADYVASGRKIGKFSGQAHDFAPGPAVQAVNPVSSGSAGVPALLQWADPLGGSKNDYDLYALDQAGNVVGFSNDVQDGDDDPFEGFYLPDGGGSPLHLAVVKFSGAKRYFQLTVFRGRFVTDGALTAYATSGVTRGHSTVPAALSVAAVPAAEPLQFALEPGDPPNPRGPFPGAFTRSQLSERFTSDGPRRVFFKPNGTALTPGNFTASGGQVRNKPDLTAADGVRTTAPGFDPFFGTSASAPHVAAIAALAWSGRPNAAAGAIKTALQNPALDIEAPGNDRDTGRGIVQTGPTLRAINAVAQPYAVAGALQLIATTDGDRYLEPGETATVDIPVTNEGDAPAPSVTVRLTTTAPGITISPASKSYGTVNAGSTITRSFSVTAAASTAPGSRVPLQAVVRFTGSFSPHTTPGEIILGQPAPPVSFPYAGPPVAIPDADPAGVALPLSVTGIGAVSQVTFTIGGNQCTTDEGSTTVGIDHTYVGDLVGTLTSPDGTTVQLFGQGGGTGHNMCQVHLTDTAERSILSMLPEEAPFTGDWKPVEPLAKFLGTQGNGTWTFTVSDLNPVDVGTARAFALSVGGYINQR